MARRERTELNLPTLDELFTTQEERDDAKLKRIYEIPLDEIDDFPDHPFKVIDDEDMFNLVESVKEYGIITPATVRIPAALRGVADELAEKDAKRKELIKHIEESEALGYDMTAYREDLGLPIPEKTPGEGLVESEPGLTTSAAQAGNPHVMRTCGEVDGRMPNCDRNCKLCYRKHCKYRQV